MRACVLCSLACSIQRIKVVLRYVPAARVTHSGLAAFARLQADWRNSPPQHGSVAVGESCEPSELQHLDVVTSSALVFLLSDRARRKCKMRFAAHAHKFVDDDHIEDLLGSTTQSANQDAPDGGGGAAAAADVEHPRPPPAKLPRGDSSYMSQTELPSPGKETPDQRAALLCKRSRRIAQHMFTRLIPQVAAVRGVVACMFLDCQACFF